MRYSLKVKFFIFSGNLLLLESIVHTVNCLKSFDFKLLFVYTLKDLSLAYSHISHNFDLL